MTVEYIPREKILVGGESGSSKTYSFLSIARALPKGHHFAIEVDDGFAKLLKAEYPDVEATCYKWSEKGWEAYYRTGKGEQLSVYHCQSFGQVLKAQKELEKLIANKVMGTGDWVCVDGGDLLYNQQRYEMIKRAVPAKVDRRNKTENSTEDPWEAAIQIKVTGAPVLEPNDWDVINTFYENFQNYLVFQIPCNVYWATGISTFNEDSKYQDSDEKLFYQSLGLPFKYEGQKRTRRAFDTLLMAKRDASGYYIHLWKDRGGGDRPWTKGRHSIMMAYSNNSFYDDVGVKLFGWPKGTP